MCDPDELIVAENTAHTDYNPVPWFSSLGFMMLPENVYYQLYNFAYETSEIKKTLMLMIIYEFIYCS